MTPIRIATRESPLAMWQAEHVAGLLAQINVPSVLVPMVSSGDVDMSPIDGTRQVGLFTKRIQQALLDDEADVAVHSLKDLPTEPNQWLSLIAIGQRETVFDSLVSKAGLSIDQLGEGAKVGTGSRRRAAQLLSRRPDLTVQPIRGNVQTRLAKIDSENFDAILLAEAGLVRLGMSDLPRHVCSLDQMLPAPGQGALAMEVRSDDCGTAEQIARLDHLPTRMAVTAERHVLAALHGGCLAPIAAHGQVRGARLHLEAVVLSADGRDRIDEKDEIDVHRDDAAEQLATRMAERMIQRGAIELIGR